MIFRESNLKSLAPHTQFQVDFFKTFKRKTVSNSPISPFFYDTKFDTVYFLSNHRLFPLL